MEYQPLETTMNTESTKSLWNDALRIGIPVIDREHHMLIELMDDFMKCAKQGCKLSKVQSTLNLLKDYTNMHFGHEEELMEEIQYEGLEAHRATHVKFCQDVENIENDIIRSFNENKSISQTRFLLYTWYTNHIQDMDRQYVALFKEKRTQGTEPGTYKLWDKSMLLGVAAIDREHKALVDIIEDFVNAVSQKKHHTDTTIKRTMLFLKNYTRLHFMHEETFMEEKGYTDLRAHCKKHEEFTTNIQLVSQKIRLNPHAKETTDAIKTLLVKWFLDHICNEDRKFVGTLST